MKWLRTYFLRCAQEKTEAKWCPCSPPILSPSSPSSAHRAIIGNKASNRTVVDFMLDKARLNPLHFYGMPSSNQGRMDLIQSGATGWYQDSPLFFSFSSKVLFEKRFSCISK